MSGKKIPFSSSDEMEGASLFDQGNVKNIIFSGGTYQVEVHDPKGNSDVWVMLQLNQDYEVTDFFCTCGAIEKEGSCSHLSAARKRVFLDFEVPLHERYKASLWYQLFSLMAERLGFYSKVLEEAGETVVGKDDDGHTVFQCKAKTVSAQSELRDALEEKNDEDQSFKLSGLSLDEITAYEKGHGSFKVRFELSFWSDLAKWVQNLYEMKKDVTIQFSQPDPILPKEIHLHSSEMELLFRIEEENWPYLLPTLVDFPSPLPVYELRDIEIKKITYHPEKKQFQIDSKPVHFEKMCQGKPKIEFDHWTFVAGSGFFAKKCDPLLLQTEIGKEEIGVFLDKFPMTIKRYLENYHYEEQPVNLNYHLEFDQSGNLMVDGYIEKPGDLSIKGSAQFLPWVFVEGLGFYRLKKMKFPKVRTVVFRQDICEFIEKERLWITQYSGFHIHLASFETKLVYRVEGETLFFESEKGQFQDRDEILDLDQWVYIKKQGFYSKRQKDDKLTLQPCTVFKEEVSDFIDDHRDELEQIPNFFTKKSPLEKTGITISADTSNHVIVEPTFVFRKDYQGKRPHVFGDYLYFQGEGFSEIPDALKLPKKFVERVTITPEEQSYFFRHEFKRLAPYILSMDSRLQEPADLRLELESVVKGERENEWKMSFSYASEHGSTPAISLWQAIHQFQIRNFSSAGRIEFKEKKFPWLSSLSKEVIDTEKNEITLTTLEWIQLQVLENVRVAPNFSSQETGFVQDLLRIGENKEAACPNLRGLKSTLRPYQELGVKWLWFLYTYGLSGFLCDEMGLGKTHQAMALLAAVMNYKKQQRPKFLIVCPTSVIYHWEELLETYLKKAKVIMYYGPGRKLRELKLKRDIILTSYGILRSDQEHFAKQNFEVVIFDEIHIAKNHRSIVHRALRSIQSNVRIGLTGTPIENHLLELKSLFSIVVPNYLPAERKFREEFIHPIEKQNDVGKQRLLSRMIHPFVLRRKKADVLDDLPEKIEEVAYVDLSNEQRKLYQEAFVRSEDLLLNEEEKPSTGDFYLHVFALINRLKQICNHPALVLKNPDQFERHQSGKWDFFVDLLEEVRESGQKLVVFSQYLDMLAIMEKYLQKEGIGYAMIQGATKDRKEQLKRFKQDPKCEVFLASLLAAGVGIDLVSASVVIHYDRWWNPAKENQATDRVYRIGQNRGVSVFKLVAKGTIEEHIHQLIMKKQSLLQNIIGYDVQEEFKKIDRDELVELLKLVRKDIYNP